MKSVKELFFIVFVALLVRIPWLLLIPSVEAPDESTHYWVIQFIVNNLRLPDYHSIMSIGSQAVYGSIPQFGYLPHILFLKCFIAFVGIAKGLYLARFGSMLMGLAVIVVAYYLGQLLFANNRIAALALPIMITFHPQFVFVTSYINNDSTTAALSAVILLLLVYALKNGLNKINTFVLSVLFAWLILSKYSGYCLLFTSSIALVLVLYLHKEKIKEQSILLLTMIFIILTLTSWWFIRNYFEFAGDITGVKTMHNIWTLTYHHYLQEFSTPLEVLFNTRFWRMLFFSFWGWFGHMTHSLPRAIYYGYLAFIILAIVQFFRRGNLLLNGSAVWFILITCFLINFLTCVYGTFSGVAGPQGRYLFPSEIPIMSMLIAGLNSRTDKWSKYIIILLVAFNIFAYFYSSIFLFKLYS